MTYTLYTHFSQNPTYIFTFLHGSGHGDKVFSVSIGLVPHEELERREAASFGQGRLERTEKLNLLLTGKNVQLIGTEDA